jgi:sorbose reductase
MNQPELATPVANEDARANLASRNLPLMILSTASNPLTAPLPRLSSQTPAESAASRFGIEGSAVITGGAGTLALAASRALLEHGLSSLCLFDLPTTLASSQAEISRLQLDFPEKVNTLAVDVTSPSAVNEAFDKVASVMGGIDILCCFAGIVGCVPSILVTPEQFSKVIDVNLTGSFLCAQAAARHMIQSKNGGSIMFTASISAHHVNFPQPQAAYNVSKIGISHLTRNLAVEWAVYGIRVNCISPGYMDTVLNAGDNLKDVRDIWASRCPMGRMGDIEEITGPVVLLCSKSAGRYITGTDLLVDGGSTCF